MIVKEYSDKEIEDVVKAFKVYMKKIVRNSAVDYARIVKSVQYREVVFSDMIDYKMSLSSSDSDIFLISEEDNSLYEEISKLISKRELEILNLSRKGYSTKEIAKILNTTTDCIKNLKGRTRRKIRNELGDFGYGRK